MPELRCGGRAEDVGKQSETKEKSLTEKTSEVGMNYSRGNAAHETTWKPAERPGYDTFYAPPPSTLQIAIIRKIQKSERNICQTTNLSGV